MLPKGVVCMQVKKLEWSEVDVGRYIAKEAGFHYRVELLIGDVYAAYRSDYFGNPPCFTYLDRSRGLEEAQSICQAHFNKHLTSLIRIHPRDPSQREEDNK